MPRGGAVVDAIICPHAIYSRVARAAVVITYHSTHSDEHAGEKAHGEVVMYTDAHNTVFQPPRPVRLDTPTRSVCVTAGPGLEVGHVGMLLDQVAVYLVDRLNLC